MLPEGAFIIEARGVPPPEELRLRAGGKAYNLLKLAALGFPVPPGFVLPATMCKSWVQSAKPTPGEFRSAYEGTLERLERASGLRFCDFRKPLLVSVRSGGPVSMPGMLDTILNVGLSQSTIPGFIALTGNPRLAWDCYRRLIEAYAQSVHGADPAPFKEAISQAFESAMASTLAELDTIALRDLAQKTLHVFQETTGGHFPEDAYMQLLNAIDAVFRSWNSERAKAYRLINSLSDEPGTAVTVQSMVFGNAGAGSGAGVGFTRDPGTGEKRLYVDFAFDAQGEDVVSGRQRVGTDAELRGMLPDVAASLDDMASRLERVFGYAQDFEFTVAEGRLYLLQTRDAKCSDWAQLKIAADLVDEGVLNPADAVQRLKAVDIEKIARKHLANPKAKPSARGISAGIGVATGSIVFTIDAARAAAQSGKGCILVREDILTEDVKGIAAASGILTARGGRTSHAAVVARELGKVAIVGCRDLRIATDGKSCTIGERMLCEGTQITLDGEGGAVYIGPVEVVVEKPDAALAKWRSWVKAA